MDRLDDHSFPTDKPSSEGTNHSNTSDSHEGGFDDLDSLEGSLASFPIQPLQALKGYFDFGEVYPKHIDGKNASYTDTEINKPTHDSDNLVRSNSLPQFVSGQKKMLSNPLMYDNMSSLKKPIGDGDRDITQPRYLADRNYSGPISYRQRRDGSNNTLAQDSSDGAIVQRKGRFQVTSADSCPKAPTCVSSVPGSTTGVAPSYLSASAILPVLQSILQQNNLQRDEIIKLIKLVEQGNLFESMDASNNCFSQTLPVSARENDLLTQVVQLQQRIGSLVDELQRQKLKNAQLERQLSASVTRTENSKN